MKKIIIALAAALMTAGFVSAQDLATATETYNAGAEQLSMGDKVAAMASFQEALSMAQSLGDEGAELVANCKKVLPGLALSIGKQFNNEKKFAEAIEKVQQAAALAAEYGDEEVAAEAEALLPGLQVSEVLFAAENSFKTKDIPAAIAGYTKVLELDPSHANAALRLVQCYSGSGDFDKAKEALEICKNLGKGNDATKVLGNAILGKANSLNKAKKFAEAYAAAQSAIEYLPDNANIYLISGNAASKINKIGDAIKNFEKYLDLAPTAGNAGAIAYTVGALYHQQGNKDKALAAFKKAQGLGFAQAAEMVNALSK